MWLLNYLSMMIIIKIFDNLLFYLLFIIIQLMYLLFLNLSYTMITYIAIIFISLFKSIIHLTYMELTLLKVIHPIKYQLKPKVLIIIILTLILLIIINLQLFLLLKHHIFNNLYWNILILQILILCYQLHHSMTFMKIFAWKINLMSF